MVSLNPTYPVLMLILMLAGCSTYQETKLPPSPVSNDEEFSTMLKTNDDVQPYWQTSIQNKQLTLLIEQALSQNLDIGMAFDRLNASRAARGIIITQQQPSALFSSSANRTSQSENSVRTTRNELSASGTLSWELDIWNRVASEIKTADYELRVQENLVAKTEALVVSELIQLYQEIHYTEKLIGLLETQIDTNTEFLNLTRFRFANGWASALEIHQQESQLISTQELRSELKRELAVLQTSISIVLGISPLSKRISDLDGTELQPPLETPSPKGLVGLRPDLRAAFYELKAADYQIASSIADRLPKISISLMGSMTGSGAGNLNNNNSLSLGPFLEFPLFDGGKRKRETERRQAKLEETIKNFTQTTLIAVKEVEDSLTSLAAYEKQISLKIKQVNTSGRSVALARQRFLQGDAEYITVLDALRTQQNEQRNLIELTRRRAFTIVTLHKAIGTRWQISSENLQSSNQQTKAENSHVF